MLRGELDALKRGRRRARGGLATVSASTTMLRRGSHGGRDSNAASPVLQWLNREDNKLEEAAAML
jgi:hypothetical protein